MSRNLAKQGDAAFGRVEKVNSEVLALTYGALVAQLVEDYEDVGAINVQLEKMGYNIGMRLVDEFLAKTAELPLWSRTPCADFREAMEVVAKVRPAPYDAHARAYVLATCRWGSRCSSVSRLTRAGPVTRAPALCAAPLTACRLPLADWRWRPQGGGPGL